VRGVFTTPITEFLKLDLTLDALAVLARPVGDALAGAALHLDEVVLGHGSTITPQMQKRNRRLAKRTAGRFYPQSARDQHTPANRIKPHIRKLHLPRDNDEEPRDARDKGAGNEAGERRGNYGSHSETVRLRLMRHEIIRCAHRRKTLANKTWL